MIDLDPQFDLSLKEVLSALAYNSVCVFEAIDILAQKQEAQALLLKQLSALLKQPRND